MLCNEWGIIEKVLLCSIWWWTYFKNSEIGVYLFFLFKLFTCCDTACMHARYNPEVKRLSQILYHYWTIPLTPQDLLWHTHDFFFVGGTCMGGGGGHREFVGGAGHVVPPGPRSYAPAHIQSVSHRDSLDHTLILSLVHSFHYSSIHSPTQFF